MSFWMTILIPTSILFVWYCWLVMSHPQGVKGFFLEENKPVSLINIFRAASPPLLSFYAFIVVLSLIIDEPFQVKTDIETLTTSVLIGLWVTWFSHRWHFLEYPRKKKKRSE